MTPITSIWEPLWEQPQLARPIVTCKETRRKNFEELPRKLRQTEEENATEWMILGGGITRAATTPRQLGFVSATLNDMEDFAGLGRGIVLD